MRLLNINIFKILSILLLLSVLSCIQFFSFNFDKYIEKEVNIINKNKSIQQSLTWKNIKNDFEFLVHKYDYLIKKEINIPEDSPIWIMWYQGIENAPPIVLSCIKSIIINRAKHKVYIINKYNLKKFVKLPDYIIEKYNNRTFSIAQFSDIIRLALLYKYGGYWIDSTYLITSPLTKTNSNFYSLKLNYDYIHLNPFFVCKWSGNFLAVPKNSFIAIYGYMAFLYYWKKYNSLIDYFLLDYVLYIAYSYSNKFKNIIDNLPYTCNILSLVKSLNSRYNKLDFNCSINKLKFRLNYKLTTHGNKTNYGYIIQKYKPNINFINQHIHK